MKEAARAIAFVSTARAAIFLRRVDDRESERCGRLFSARSSGRPGPRKRSAFAVRNRVWGLRLDVANSAIFNHVEISRCAGWGQPSRLDAVFILSDFGCGGVNKAVHRSAIGVI